MTTQYSDPPREPTDKRSEVLSDATDLDALLEAILGDEIAPVTAQGRPPDDVTAPAEAAARPESAVVTPPLAEVDREDAFPRGATTADDNDAWGFVSEDPQEGNEIAADFSAVRQTEPTSLESPPSRRTWRDKLRASLSKQSLVVAALLAAALITVSAIRLRDEPTATEPLPSPEAPALVRSSSPVEGASAVRAIDSSQVEVWAAAREPQKQPRVMSRTPPRRTNEATGERTNPPATPASVGAPRSAPTASPVAASPALVEPTIELSARDAAPSRTATPEGEPGRLIDSEPAAAASSGGVLNGTEPAPTAVAPLPAGLPRRSAARLVTGAAPEYPAALRTARIGGNVEVRFTIDSSGRVINVQSLTGPPQLRAAAEAAVKRWRYDAARLDNLAVETQTTVRFNFDPSRERRPQE